jgi:hypothetical protein
MSINTINSEVVPPGMVGHPTAQKQERIPARAIKAKYFKIDNNRLRYLSIN